MKKIIKGLYRKEEGQILIFTGIIMAVLMGFSAIALDVGMMTIEKSKLQNVADAAALAGAQELPDAGKAKTAAKEYAKANGVELKPENIITPVDGDNKKLKIIAERKVSHTMARMIGIKETNVKSTAVAQGNPGWAGDALPFINLGNEYSINSKFVEWDKGDPGDFGSILSSDYTYDNVSKFFKIKYSDGISITKGKVANIKDEVQTVYDAHKSEEIYIFSLSNKAMEEYSGEKFKNKDVIPLEDLVLLKVTFDFYDGKGKTLDLTVKGVYEIKDGVVQIEDSSKSKLIG